MKSIELLTKLNNKHYVFVEKLKIFPNLLLFLKKLCSTKKPLRS